MDTPPAERRKFLTATWKNLILANYAVPEDLLRPLLPPGIDLDRRDGECWASDPKRKPGIKARRRMKRRMRTAAYKLSQKCRKKVEEGFGWLKTVAGLDRCRTVGRWKLKQLLQIGAAAYNLVRMRKLAKA